MDSKHQSHVEDLRNDKTFILISFVLTKQSFERRVKMRTSQFLYSLLSSEETHTKAQASMGLVVFQQEIFHYKVKVESAWIFKSDQTEALLLPILGFSICSCYTNPKATEIDCRDFTERYQSTNFIIGDLRINVSCPEGEWSNSAPSPQRRWSSQNQHTIKAPSWSTPWLMKNSTSQFTLLHLRSFTLTIKTFQSELQ